MTPVRPQDRPKVIALLAALAGVFGIVLWQVLAPRSGNAPAPVADAGTAVPVPTAPAPVGNVPSAPSGAANETTAPATGTAPSGTGATPGTVFVSNDRPIVRPNLTKNPFKPLPPPPVPVAAGTGPGATGGAAPAPARSGIVTVVPVPTPSRFPVAATPLPAAPAPLLPRMGIKQGGPPPIPERFAPPAPNGPRILPAPVAPLKPLQLVGVVWGARPVAMIRVGGQEFFVRQGERVADYRVIGLGMENVTLRSDKKARFVLRVGDPPLGGALSPVALDAPEAVSFAAPVPPPAVAGPAAAAAPAPPTAAHAQAAAPLLATTPGLPASTRVSGTSEAAPAAAPLDPASSAPAPAPAPETPDPATPPEPGTPALPNTPATMPPALPRTGEPEDGGTDG